MKILDSGLCSASRWSTGHKIRSCCSLYTPFPVSWPPDTSVVFGMPPVQLHCAPAAWTCSCTR